MPEKKEKPKKDEPLDIPWKPDKTQVREIELAEKPKKDKKKENET